jgi:hypothetical protein
MHCGSHCLFYRFGVPFGIVCFLPDGEQVDVCPKHCGRGSCLLFVLVLGASDLPQRYPRVSQSTEPPLCHWHERDQADDPSL